MENKKHNVILVDDHPVILNGMVNVLAELDKVNIVAAVSSGVKALECLNFFDVDLIITDIEMPEMSGIDLVKLIKEKHPKIKTIILSMYNEISLAKRLMQLEVDGFVLKNADKNEIIFAINSVLNDKKYFSSDLTNSLASSETPIIPNQKLVDELTPREIEILKLITHGFSNKEIANQLFISHKTVDTHRTNVMNKLDIHNVAGLTRFSIHNKLI